MARKLALAGAAALGCVLAAASSALAGNGGIAPPDSVTDSGSAINRLYWVIFGICALIFILVEAALLLFVFRFRRRKTDPEGGEGPQLHGNTRLEVIWTIVPVVILVVIAVVTFVSVPTVNAKPSGGGDAITVQVTAHQFYWQYEYPNGALSFDTLRVPVGTTVSLRLRSEDVVHSWWVPEITGKRDAIPGRTNTLDFKVERAGVYEGQCAEFCGIQHAVMVTRVEAVPLAEYQAWVEQEGAAQAGTGGTSTLGKQEFGAVCAKCHGLAGEGDIGPSLVGKITSRNSLETLLFQGQNQPNLPSFMPAVGSGWSSAQVDALFAYLTTDPALSGSAAGASNGG
jgi:cytochrome c oxidase subunit 2